MTDDMKTSSYKQESSSEEKYVCSFIWKEMFTRIQYFSVDIEQCNKYFNLRSNNTYEKRLNLIVTICRIQWFRL